MQLKNILIGLAIVILTALVVGYGIETFYPSPEYNDFCDRDKIIPRIIADTQENCEAEGGEWNPYQGPRPVEGAEGYCDFYSECQAEFEDVNESYSKNLFIITIILGIILIAVGGALFELEAVGAGIMGGGIITIIYGSIRYWQYAGDFFRFILSLIGLIFVIVLAYWLNNRQKKGKKWIFSFNARRG